jgi:hypothetical protein
MSKLVHVQTVLSEEDLEALKGKMGETNTKDTLAKAAALFVEVLSDEEVEALKKKTGQEDINKAIEAAVVFYLADENQRTKYFVKKMKKVIKEIENQQ